MRRHRQRRTIKQAPIAWLPVDSRLILPLFSFGHVKGIARIFLEIEIVLSLLVVVGALVLLAFSVMGFTA